MIGRLAVAATLAIVATGCGSRCHEVATALAAVRSRAGATDRGADVRVTVPLGRANALIAELLRVQPVTMPLDVPDLGPIELSVNGGLIATAREVVVKPAAPGKLRFAMRIAIHDANEEITTLAMLAEVTPVLERKDGVTELAIGFGPENLLTLEPELGAGATAALGNAVSRWIPAKLRDRLPRPVLDAGVKRLGSHLTGAAYQGLRRTLLKRLGDVTRLHLRLPAVPIATTSIRSTVQPAEALIVEIATDLPVRRGLADHPTAPPPRDLAPAGDDVSVELSGSAVAELANWAIESGHAPRWYDRGLTARPDGEFRPWFDYVAEDAAHPIKVYAFQERGGCSYFRVGARAAVAMNGPKLDVTALDRTLERASASPVIEIAAWVKYFLFGSLDQTKQLVAHTRLSVGGRALDTRVVDATLAHDEVRFSLRFAAAPGTN